MAEEQKFTPGPWVCEEIRHDGKWYVIGADAQTLVCLCNSGNADNAGNEANARLIAQAPALFEALKELLKHYLNLADSGDCGFWDSSKEPEVIQAKAAIEAVEKEVPG